MFMCCGYGARLNSHQIFFRPSLSEFSGSALAVTGIISDNRRLPQKDGSYSQGIKKKNVHLDDWKLYRVRTFSRSSL